jgi:predicted RNA-binding Zn-ribbon protein involved in translation (DUF1610 family)
MTTVTSTVNLDQKGNKEIYSDPDARQILQFLLRNITTVISPQTLANDEVTYPQLQPILGERTSDAEAVLSRMAESGVLVEDMADKVPACPDCNSKQVSSRYLCPQCFSFDIARSFLFEHLKCGKVASDDSFRKGDEFVCPKCQAVLHNFGVEFRAIGAWYKCNRCSNSFNAAVHSHFCRQKHHQFTPERARLVPIYEYKINTRNLNEIRNQVLVYGDLITFLEDAGLTVIAPHLLSGKSGEQRSFDIVITSKGRWGAQKIVAMDVINSDSEVGSDFVREFAAKVRDSKPTASYLIALPKLTTEAKDVARNLKLTVVEGPSLKEAMDPIRELAAIKELIS